MKKLSNRSYFFDQGLRFECQRCGVCCTGEPGTIFVNQQEIVKIAHFTKIPQALLISDYLYPYKDSYSIGEHPDGRCLFFQNGCAIYPVRPSQCKTYPFWFQNLRSPKNWHRASRECPGIGQGPKFEKEKILSLMSLYFIP